VTLRSIQRFISRHRLTTLIASGALVLAAAAPVAAHHPGSVPGREATFSGTLDSISDEVDGWEAAELDRTGGSPNAHDTTDQDVTGSHDKADEATTTESGDAEAGSDSGSGAGGDFEHSGTSDHGRPHRAGGSDDSVGGQGGTSNG
jgi:hypothetical protein